MAAREPGDGLRSTSRHDTAIRAEHERKRAREESEEMRKWSVGNYWGFSLEGIFGLALKFFKEMNGKAFNPTYEENLLFAALQKQIFLGPYSPEFGPEVGFFDVLGNDRRRKWAELGSMAKQDAMEEFVKLMNSCCSRFSPYVTSHQIEKEERERRSRAEEERLRLEREEEHHQEEQCREKEKSRAEAERLPSNQHTQQVLIVQTEVPVQNQQRILHYPEEQRDAECVEQAHHTHHGKQADAADTPLPDSNVTPSDTKSAGQSEASQREKSAANPKQCHLFIEAQPGEARITAPSMWTMAELNEFKAKTQRDAESVVTVGRGEVLTVHIPTHQDGTTFFWEFATDYYDIAFGLYFEWPGAGGVGAGRRGCAESAATGRTPERDPADAFCRVSEVVPLFRRDSHECVYAGSHRYPSQGVYLLRFDNSYSLWRSKVVYYRVYYTG